MQPSEPPWLSGAIPVATDFDSLEAASGDAPYILDQDDIEDAVAWVIANIPISTIQQGFCRETPNARLTRLETIRKLPQEQLFRPIFHGSIDGSVTLIDGGHRIEIAAERGHTLISALVKLDFQPFMHDLPGRKCETPVPRG